MKNTNKNLLLKIVGAAMLATAYVFAAPLSTNILVTELEPSIGQDVTLTLRINPDAVNPVYTVSARLSYDTDRLKFKSVSFGDDSAVSLSKVPYYLTDTTEGIIVRTAGFPNGISSSANFVRYTFTAVKSGQATISVLGGQALDAENNDMGLEKKDVILNIGGTAEEPKAEPVNQVKKTIPKPSVNYQQVVSPIVGEVVSSTTDKTETPDCLKGEGDSHADDANIWKIVSGILLLLLIAEVMKNKFTGYHKK
jgi:hypothetical protein